MSRSVPEWVGTNDDTPIPPRVKLRVFKAYGGRCAICTRRIGGSVCAAYDHRDSLINGGENRETNVQLLCVECHTKKTGQDTSIKSKNYRVAIKHTGIRRRKGRPMLGTKASGWKQKMDGTWERR